VAVQWFHAKIFYTGGDITYINREWRKEVKKILSLLNLYGCLWKKRVFDMLKMKFYVNVTVPNVSQYHNQKFCCEKISHVILTSSLRLYRVNYVTQVISLNFSNTLRHIKFIFFSCGENPINGFIATMFECELNVMLQLRKILSNILKMRGTEGKLREFSPLASLSQNVNRILLHEWDKKTPKKH
jgi:hypothetical protein